VSTTDGLAETKEQLGGFFLIEAGHERGVRGGLAFPSGAHRIIEVRPVRG
jgi:hypothetical protein